MVHVSSLGCYQGAFHSTTCTVGALDVPDVTRIHCECKAHSAVLQSSFGSGEAPDARTVRLSLRFRKDVHLAQVIKQHGWGV